MNKRFLPLAFLAFSSVATAATVEFGVDDANVTVIDSVSEAAYRLNQGDWDQMLSNGADPAGVADMTSIDYAGGTALNNTTWNFSITYESGDDGVQGFTFVMNQVGGAGDSGTLFYDLNNPLNGQTPTGVFNVIGIEANAGSLLDPTSYNETAYMDISNLTFTSTLSSSGALANPLAADSATQEQANTWITSSVDLNSVDWVLTGTVTAGHDCNGSGSVGCLTDDSVRMNLTFAQATVVPLPAAVWLFGSALAGLGWLRRR